MLVVIIILADMGNGKIAYFVIATVQEIYYKFFFFHPS